MIPTITTNPRGFYVLVCGGRAYFDHDRVNAILSRLHAKRPIQLLMHGGCTGADELAHKWAIDNEIDMILTVPAKWRLHGKAAGPLRNRAMLLMAVPDMVIAFPGGKGTANMVDAAERHAAATGLDTHIVRVPA